MKTTLSFTRALLAVVAISVFAFAASAAAQGASLTGKVTRDNGDPMAGATVVLDELKQEVRTGADGTYRFDNVPPGTYHVDVRAEGYSTHRTEVAVTPQGATLDLVVELDLHFSEVVSVSPNARSQFESYQPTSVLAGQELQKAPRGHARRDAAGAARRRDAGARARPGASGDPRPRRRSRRRARRMASASAICRASPPITASP